MTEEDPPRDETEGRGQGNGEWLENRLSETLSEWGYRTEPNEPLLGLEVDVIARKEELCDEPTDWLVCECKDWMTRAIPEEVIIRLCLTAYVARAMPVLCFSSYLTERAWELAQLFDVRLLRPKQLYEYDSLPPLTLHRPPTVRQPERESKHIGNFRSQMPLILYRKGLSEVEAPQFLGRGEGPCYVPDRTGHNDYVASYSSDFDFTI